MLKWEEIRARLTENPELRVIHVIPHPSREARALAVDFKDRYHAVCPGEMLAGRRANEIHVDMPVDWHMLRWFQSVLCRVCPMENIRG